MTGVQTCALPISIAETSERGITFDAKFIESLHGECEAYIRNETQVYFTPKFTKGEIVVLPEVSDLKKDKQLKKRCTARLDYFDYDGIIVSSTAHHAWERCPVTPIRLSSATHASHSFLIKRDAPQYIAETGNIDTETLVTKSLKGDGTLKTDIPNSVRDYFIGNKLAMVLGAKERYFKHLDENNRVHTRFNPVGTRTGRLSSSNPNLQNLGGSAKTGVTGLDALIKQQRKFVIASPGYLLVGADYDSIEVVILAHILEIFGDVRMKKALATGVSPHDVNKEAWGCDRLTAKRGLFSIVYGATEWKLQTILDCSLNEAKQFLDKVNSGMPAISKAKAHYTRMCRELGGVFDLFGNFYDYPEVSSSDIKLRSRAERQLFNAVIQGTCASLVSWVIPQVAEVVRRYDGYLLSVIHDELITEVPVSAAEEAKDALNSLTQKRKDIEHLLTSVVNADWVIGDSWSSIH